MSEAIDVGPAPKPKQSSGVSVWRPQYGLSSRLLLVILLFVGLATIAVFVPLVTNYRNIWLSNKLSSAYVAALVLEVAPADLIPAGLSQELLDNVGAKAIVIKIHGRRRLLAISDMPPKVDETYDTRSAMPLEAIAATYRAFVAPSGRMLNIVGPAPMGGDSIEIVTDETELQNELHRQAVNILLLALTISLAFGALVVTALQFAIVRPVVRLTRSLMEFEAEPEDVTRIMVPSSKNHEIGRAERALRSMQLKLVRELKQKKHLADLGLAVAKINHDLRNMLTSAQLLTDRMASVPDPLTQRLAPKLVSTLDRAIRFCQSTLTYGRAVDEPPVLRRFRLRPLIAEAVETVYPFEGQPNPGRRTVLVSKEIPPDIQIRADAEQIFRVIANLLRNAIDALESVGPAAGEQARIKIAASQSAKAVVIVMADNGPGVPAELRPRIFAAFQGSTRPGGSGLGLAIASDLVRAHGGTIELLEQPPNRPGATFRITLPPANGHA